MRFATTALLATLSGLVAASPVNLTAINATSEWTSTVYASTTITQYTTVWVNCTETPPASWLTGVKNATSVAPFWNTAVTTSDSASATSDAPAWSTLISSTSSTVPSLYSTTETTTVYVTTNAPSATTPTSTELTITTTVSTNKASVATGAVYAGDGTWYETGLGACGQVNTDTDYIAALGWGLFDQYTPGTNPNVNTLCGRKIRVSYQGKSVVVTAVDRCEGCKPYDLDLSPAAFSQLAHQDVGRIKITWEMI